MIAVLTRPRKGKVMLTVAPERVPVATIKRLVDAGVLVSAGIARPATNRRWRRSMSG
ncbi:Uncharacterised protein [Sphingomonas paucimobilis]|nr:Uncharacterised protein [Sphingomonas paucimobilis]